MSDTSIINNFSGSTLDLFDAVDQVLDKQSSSGSSISHRENSILSSKSYSSSTLDVLNSLIGFGDPSASKPPPNKTVEFPTKSTSTPSSPTLLKNNPNNNNRSPGLDTSVVDDDLDIDSLIMDIDSLVTDLGGIEKDLRKSRHILAQSQKFDKSTLDKEFNNLKKTFNFTTPQLHFKNDSKLVDSSDNIDDNNNSISPPPPQQNVKYSSSGDNTMDEIKDLIKLSESQLHIAAQVPKHCTTVEQTDPWESILPSPPTTPKSSETTPTLSPIETKNNLILANIEDNNNNNRNGEGQPPLPLLPTMPESSSVPSSTESTPREVGESEDMLSPRGTVNTPITLSGSKSFISPSNTPNSPVLRHTLSSPSSKWTFAVRKSTLSGSGGYGSPTNSANITPPDSPGLESQQVDSPTGKTKPLHVWRKSNSTHPRSSTDPLKTMTFDRKSIISLDTVDEAKSKHRSTFPGSLDEIKNHPNHNLSSTSTSTSPSNCNNSIYTTNSTSPTISSPVLTRSTVAAKPGHHAHANSPILTFDYNGMEYSILDPKKQKIDLENQTKINRLNDLLKNYRNKIISLISKISKENEESQRDKTASLAKFEKRSKFYQSNHQLRMLDHYRKYYAVKMTLFDISVTIGKERIEFLKSKLIHIGNLIEYLRNYDRDKSQRIVVYSSFFLKQHELLNSNIDIVKNLRRLKIIQFKEKKAKDKYQLFKENVYNTDSVERREKKLLSVITRAIPHHEFKNYYHWEDNQEIQLEFATLILDSRFKEGKQIHELINILSDDCTGPKNIKPIDIELFIEKFIDKLIDNYNLTQTPPTPAHPPIGAVYVGGSSGSLKKSNGISVSNSSSSASLFAPEGTEPSVLTSSISMLPLPPLNIPELKLSKEQIFNILMQLFKRIFYPKIYNLMKIILSKEIGGTSLKYDQDLCTRVSQFANLDLIELNLLPTNFPTNLDSKKMLEYYASSIDTLNGLCFHVVPIDLVYVIQQTLSSIYSTSIEIIKKKILDKDMSNRTSTIFDLDTATKAFASVSPIPSPPLSPTGTRSTSSKSFYVPLNNEKLKTGSFIGKGQHLSFESVRQRELEAREQQKQMELQSISLSADDLFPLLIYVLMNSSIIGYSKTIVSIVEQFSSTLETNGEFGWCSVSFQAAISHLHQLDS